MVIDHGNPWCRGRPTIFKCHSYQFIYPSMVSTRVNQASLTSGISYSSRTVQRMSVLLGNQTWEWEILLENPLHRDIKWEFSAATMDKPRDRWNEGPVTVRTSVLFEKYVWTASMRPRSVSKPRKRTAAPIHGRSSGSQKFKGTNLVPYFWSYFLGIFPEI